MCVMQLSDLHKIKIIIVKLYIKYNLNNKMCTTYNARGQPLRNHYSGNTLYCFLK